MKFFKQFLTLGLPVIAMAFFISACSSTEDTASGPELQPGPDPVLCVDNSALNLGKSGTGAKVYISSCNGESLDWKIISDQGWLTAFPAAGSVNAETDTVSVSISRSGLVYGNYSGRLIVSSTGGSDTVAVSMEIIPYMTIRTFAGDGVSAKGGENEDPLVTSFYWPQDIAFDPAGLAYIVDWNNHRIRRIENGLISTIIGTGELGDAEGERAIDIGLNHPTNVAFDNEGFLILSAWHNSKVLKMDIFSGRIATICGDGTRSFRGDGGPADSAWLDIPSATVCDAQGRMYIADQANQRVRMVDTNGIISTVVGDGVAGFLGDGLQATSARISGSVGQLAFPSSKITLDAQGSLYLADTKNNRVRKVDLNGIINTVAGNGAYGFSGDGGPATGASLRWPTDIAFDSEGNLYIADTYNSCIRRVDISGNISTFAGRGELPGFAGDGGAPEAARLNRPYGIALDSDDNIYIADTYNHRIRVILK